MAETTGTVIRSSLTAREAGSAASKLVLSYRSVRPRSLSAIEDTPARSTVLTEELRPRYRSLDFANYETRFLELQPGSKTDVPSCCLKHASLAYPPDYVALSYAWGDAIETTSIVVDGKLVRVSANLKAALQEMLSEGVTCAWVDALCINQANLFERSYQVSLMGKIYAKAAKVVAWLGPPSDDSTIAMRYLQEAADRRRYGIVGGSAIMSPDSLSKLFARPYWQRMWVVQEIAKAKEVELWCGSEHVSWQDMAEMNPQHWLQGRERMLLQNIHHFRLREQGSRIGVARMLLSEALLYTSSLKATDSRDKVYALLGLTLDGSDVVPTPSYNTDAIEVFRQISSFMIQDEGQTSLLLLAGRRQNCPDLPSWLPIWCDVEKKKHQLASTAIELKPARRPHPYAAPEWISKCVRTKRETLNFNTTIDTDLLHLRAIRLEQITDPQKPLTLAKPRSSRFWHWPIDRAFCVMLELWEFFLRGHARSTSCRLGRPDDSPFWAKDIDSNVRKGLLLAHIFEADFNHYAYPSFGIIKNWLRQHRFRALHEHDVGTWIGQFRRRVGVLRQVQLKGGVSDALLETSFEKEREELRNICPALGGIGMKTVVSNSGAFRLVYKDAGPTLFTPGAPYDAIYRLENCALPVVLRRVSAKGEPERFKLIGEVYLSLQDDHSHWTNNTGWTEDNFRAECWKQITII